MLECYAAAFGSPRLMMEATFEKLLVRLAEGEGSQLEAAPKAFD
jgi:hypothetical protein